MEISIITELEKLYDLRKHHMDCLNDWKGSEVLTRAGMCADLAIIESKIEILEKSLPKK